MNPEIMRACGFSQAVDDKEEGRCPFCRKPVDPDQFTRATERKEFEISGLCLTCQRHVFGE